MNEFSEKYLTRVSFFMNSIVTFPHRSVEFARNVVDDLEDHDEMKRMCQHLINVLQAKLPGAPEGTEHLVQVAKDLQGSHDPYIRIAGACLDRAIRLFEESSMPPRPGQSILTLEP